MLLQCGPKGALLMSLFVRLEHLYSLISPSSYKLPFLQLLTVLFHGLKVFSLNGNNIKTAATRQDTVMVKLHVRLAKLCLKTSRD